MRVVFSPRYHLEFGAHVFPTIKYRLVADAVVRRGVAPAGFVAPEPADWAALALVHTDRYLDALRRGTLPPDEQARLEIPFSPEVVEGFRLMTGGTITAARLALDGADRVAVHIGGGFHHAFAGHGEGFCMFNDVAVAIRQVQQERLAHRAAVVDLDVHHGNGTAAIFAGDARVFTLSIHEEDNYPAVKPRGSLDVGLARGTGDAAYLAALDEALPRVLGHEPDVVFFLAGADPYAHDQLGGLALSAAGLRARDRRVFQATRDAGVPVVTLLAGGYARRVEDTVAIHAATIEEAARG